MENMIPSTQTPVKSRKATSSRDNEIKTGWEAYYKIACRLAWRWHSKWFPTRDDLGQAAALAASVAINELGEETILRELTRVLTREINLQTIAYGHRRVYVSQPGGGKKKQININLETVYSEFESEFEQGNSSTVEYLESRMMIVGVGEYTRKHAHFLHDLLH